MFKFIKNKFLFIVLISIATLAVLVIGAVSLYKDNSLVFAEDGYILETSTKTNKKYYFTANTKYKENVEEKITFSDKDSNEVSVEPASFVHYTNGNVSFLKQGALVNLSDITSPMVSYYNITNENTIVYEKDLYTVTSNDKKISIESFIGRISDNKYLIAGKDLTLKIPTEEDIIAGEYFEILFIEEGIVKIDNEEHSYQVTAQDSYIYIGDNIAISLVDGKISYDGDVKMLLSQITINGDENIDLDIEKENSSGGSGDGSGSGTGEGSGEDGDGTGLGEGEGTGDSTGESGDGTGTGTGTGGGAGTGNKTTENPKIELIEAIVTSTSIDLTMQLNNANLAKGNVVAYLTNVANGRKETPKRIELTNGTFKLPYSSLMPNTDYALTIVETGIANEKQYFQKTFKTKELGISLEKTYATDNSLSYNMIFDENTDVSKVHISIYDNNGENKNISPNEFTISKEELNNNIVFTGLKSNTSYSINVDTIWIGNTAYSNLYTINRIDTTLKQTPKLSGVNVDSNSEEIKFTIELENVEDKDKSIISYTYNIYLADDITLENENPTVQYSVTKNDSDPLVLNLNEIDELKTGVDYRCKIVAQYNDNEMIREVSTDYSGNFLIRSKPNISFKQLNTGMSEVTGIITLIDANCTVPMSGRSCANTSNTFILRYYNVEEDETESIDKPIKFDSKTLTSEITLDELKSNSTYVVKLFGSYNDDNNVLHPNVQIGDTFYVKTNKSPEIYFEPSKDNISTDDDVVTFDAKLSAPKDTDIEALAKEISEIKFNLYSGRYNTSDKLIGTYTITDKTSIEDLFNNITIKNRLFEDVTKYKLGKLDTIEKLIKVTNNTTGTLNGAYTIEVSGEYGEGDPIIIENNIYTFNLTASYYLDARIETNPNEPYITVTQIPKSSLTEEEKAELADKNKNFDELKDDTTVAITIENSLSDIFVDSAFTYEKAIVNYIICNNTTKKCDNIIEQLQTLGNKTDEQSKADYEKYKEQVKIISVDMGNKYQPKSQTVYLDSSELDDGNKYFTRGYKYKIGYTINFITEDGSNPIYTHEKLKKIEEIKRQAPDYTQYISTSNSNGVTYRYTFKDTDGALANKNFYYTLGEDDCNNKDDKCNEIKNSLIANNEYQDVTIPISNNSEYKLYYAKKTTSNETEYIEIATNEFATEYKYSPEEDVSHYTLSDAGNVLRITLDNIDVTNRAAAYKVVIKSEGISNYTRYFLASQLSSISKDTGSTDEEGNPITIDYKYIDIDYANISKFMGHEIQVIVYSYYDNGLVGYNQSFDKGLILKNRKDNKYLNIYNGSSNTTSTFKVEDGNMGLYLLKEVYNEAEKSIFIYNQLQNTNSYNKLTGATFYETKDSASHSNIGIKFEATPTENGMKLAANSKDYTGYDAKVLSEAQLKIKEDKDLYTFNSIVPTIKPTTNNTINSIKININPSGIYGNKQFTKDNTIHNVAYIELYDSQECAENKDCKYSKREEANIKISGNDESGYIATISSVEFTNLTPETEYYYKVYAYIENDYTQLYDSKLENSAYVTQTYKTSTLNATEIISRVELRVEPTAYGEGTNSEKKLSWKLNLKNTENYSLRFELYEPESNTTTIDPETGEEVAVTNYKPVKFDGTSATACDKTTFGDNSNGYVNNCYISIATDKVSAIDKKKQTYTFTGNNFIFGGNYYKLLIYAIPYSDEKYNEEAKVLLYQNDKLTSNVNSSQDEKVNGVNSNIYIPLLEEVKFDLSNSLETGYECLEYNNDNSCAKADYHISFKPTVTDNHYIMNDGKYTIELKDENMKSIQVLTGQTAGNKHNGTIGEVVKFTGLEPTKLYYIGLSYEGYRNNVGFTEEDKRKTTSYTEFIYTTSSNLTVGTISAKQNTSQAITLVYNGASSDIVDKIVQVDYTIKLIGGTGGQVRGSYRLKNNETSKIEGFNGNIDNIFTRGTDKITKLILDVSNIKNEGLSDNPSFTFKSGNTYTIETQYYYLVEENGNNRLELLENPSGGVSFNTMLIL